MDGWMDGWMGRGSSLLFFLIATISCYPLFVGLVAWLENTQTVDLIALHSLLTRVTSSAYTQLSCTPKGLYHTQLSCTPKGLYVSGWLWVWIILSFDCRNTCAHECLLPLTTLVMVNAAGEFVAAHTTVTRHCRLSKRTTEPYNDTVIGTTILKYKIKQTCTALRS